VYTCSVTLIDECGSVDHHSEVVSGTTLKITNNNWVYIWIIQFHQHWSTSLRLVPHKGSVPAHGLVPRPHCHTCDTYDFNSNSSGCCVIQNGESVGYYSPTKNTLLLTVLKVSCKIIIVCWQVWTSDDWLRQRWSSAYEVPQDMSMTIYSYDCFVSILCTTDSVLVISEYYRKVLCIIKRKYSRST